MITLTGGNNGFWDESCIFGFCAWARYGTFIARCVDNMANLLTLWLHSRWIYWIKFQVSEYRICLWRSMWALEWNVLAWYVLQTGYLLGLNVFSCRLEKISVAQWFDIDISVMKIGCWRKGGTADCKEWHLTSLNVFVFWMGKRKVPWIVKCYKDWKLIETIVTIFWSEKIGLWRVVNITWSNSWTSKKYLSDCSQRNATKKIIKNMDFLLHSKEKPDQLLPEPLEKLGIPLCRTFPKPSLYNSGRRWSIAPSAWNPGHISIPEYGNVPLEVLPPKMLESEFEQIARFQDDIAA